MNTLLLKQDTIKVDVEAAKFEARGIHPFGWHLGKVTLQLDHEGIHLINKKGKTYSTTNWADMRRAARSSFFTERSSSAPAS